MENFGANGEYNTANEGGEMEDAAATGFEDPVEGELWHTISTFAP